MAMPVAATQIIRLVGRKTGRHSAAVISKSRDRAADPRTARSKETEDGVPRQILKDADGAEVR